MPSSPIHPVVRRFIEDAGSATQSFGLGRVIGQLYAYLYFNQEPRSLDDMRTALAISKGSASMAVRQLEQWNAVQKIWVRGDRKDYYQAKDAFGKIIKAAVLDTVGKKMGDYGALLDEADEHLNRGVEEDRNGHDAYLQGRVQHLRKFQRWAQQVWNSRPLKQMLKL
ncbi:MAG: hypothetical protein O2901_08550 [Verrucomicrobia bacterium]|nr:hypothetical protein [Verrucomicrobiota bacterium]